MKDRPLTVEVMDDELQIRIGLSVLKMAAERNPLFFDFNQHDYDDEEYVNVTDERTLAVDVARELNREQEDGTTPVHLMLAQAVFDAMENGSEAFDDCL